MSVKLFDPTTGRQISEIDTGLRFVHTLAFTPYGKTLFAGGIRDAESSLAAIDLTTGHRRSIREPDDRIIATLAISRDGRFLATAGFGGMSLHATKGGRVLRQIDNYGGNRVTTDSSRSHT